MPLSSFRNYTPDGADVVKGEEYSFEIKKTTEIMQTIGPRSVNTVIIFLLDAVFSVDYSLFYSHRSAPRTPFGQLGIQALTDRPHQDFAEYVCTASGAMQRFGPGQLQ